MVKTISFKNINVVSNIKETIYKRKKQKEEYYKSIIKAIEESEDDIRNGRVIPMEDVLKELRDKYGY